MLLGFTTLIMYFHEQIMHLCFAPFIGGGGHKEFYLALMEGGGAQKVLDLQFFHFVTPPPCY